MSLFTSSTSLIVSLLCFTAAHGLVQCYLVVEVVLPDDNDTVLRLVRVITYFRFFHLASKYIRVQGNLGESPFLTKYFDSKKLCSRSNIQFSF